MARRDNGKRLEKLEAMLESLNDDKHRPVHPDFVAFDKELSAVSPAPDWRGGVKVERPDEAFSYYGRLYSQKELFELTMRRALSGRGCYTSEEVDERTAMWMAWFEENGPLGDERCLGGEGTGYEGL